MDAYTAGVKDAVELINENEELGLTVRDVINALKIKAISEEMED